MCSGDLKEAEERANPENRTKLGSATVFRPVRQEIMESKPVSSTTTIQEIVQPVQ